MASHFSILPLDIIQFLSLSLVSESSLTSEKEPLRVLRLPHPRTGLPSLFLPVEWLPSMPENPASLLEIQAVSPTEERSWIMGEEVVADGKLLSMTPIDPAFLLLPIMQATQPVDGSTPPFRTADDLFDEAARRLGATNDSEAALSLHIQDLLNFCSLACTRKSLARLCDVKEISSEIVVYRYSPTKFMEYMRSKVAHLSKSAALDGSRTLIRSLAKDGLMEDGQEALWTLGRIRACCDLVAQYLPLDLRNALMSTYDFSKLQKHLDSNQEEAIAKAATAAPAKAQTKAEKTAAGKKRKAAKPSVGVEKLKKANTTGMAKLSSFFNKA
ncbi:ribonuclease H2, subunit B [Flammula alnicola]|nr:ribonuclease H2, subunit B [Flammula alnicola]